ncbi:MAG: hypothetical protein ACF8R7_05440 [Phycisphaerales bacterium JB039]
MAKKSKRSKARSRPRLPAIRFSRAGAMGAINIGATVVVFGGVAAGAVFGGPALAERFEASRKQALREAGGAPEIQINWPAWLPADEQTRLAQIAQWALEGASAGPLSAAPLRAIGASLAETGWFAQLPSVQRAAGGVIAVEGDWLEPRFAIRWPPTPSGAAIQRDHLVTRQARLTPMWYPADGSHLPLILGPQAGPPVTAQGAPGFGQIWPDEGVAHAIALLQLLVAEPYFDQILGISVAEYPATGRLVIVTNWGSEVVWGSPLDVDATHRGEVRAELRLVNLRALQASYTRIDAGQRRVDVYRPSVEIAPGRAP